VLELAAEKLALVEEAERRVVRMLEQSTSSELRPP
jgi:hypothetical protein